MVDEYAICIVESMAIEFGINKHNLQYSSLCDNWQGQVF